MAKELASIEWTTSTEMQLPELCLAYFISFAVLALIPLIVMLIWKSEGKQARFSLLQLQIKEETVVVGNNETTSANNFKLVQTWGNLTTL